MPLMLGARVVGAFPWEAVGRSSRRIEATLRAGRRQLDAAVVSGSVAERLSEFINAPVEVVVRHVDGRLPAGPMWRLGFIPQTGVGVGVGAEAALAAALLSRFLRRPLPIVPAELPPEPALLGALAALLVEAARATGASEALRPAPAPEPANAAVVHLTVIVAGRPYVAAAWFAPSLGVEQEPAPGALLRLGSIELELPVVIGVGLSTAAELAELRVGDAWCPGAGLWVTRSGVGRAALVAGSAESGIAAELLPDGRIVVGEPTKVALAAPESIVKSDAESPPALEQAVLEAPLVVRVELASVSLAAREWACLKPGDVLETRRRLGGPVVLRAGGQALAHGELVNIEGELGVRVTRLLPPEAT
jgi:flagellar motor switch/type III secretory pathway protein FliN